MEASESGLRGERPHRDQSGIDVRRSDGLLADEVARGEPGKGDQQRSIKMKRQTRILVALLGTLAFVSQGDAVAAADQESSSQASTGKQRPPSDIYDPLGLVAAGRHGQLVTLASGFSFTEGPAADRHGNVYFTDQPNDRIYRWDAGTRKVELFLEGTGRANGMAFDREGNLIAAADMYGELWKIRPDGTHEVLVDNYQGKMLNGPNDVWINPTNGGIYLTDPIFPRAYWDADDPRQQPWEPTHSEQAPQGKGGYVYYLPPGGRKLVRVTTETMGWESDAWPNGVVGKLYVNKWYYDNKGGTWVFDIKPGGRLTNMRKFTDWGGDGMSMDELGNIYISNGEGVLAFDPNGTLILKIPTGSGATNNTFAGRDGKTLFITGPADQVTAIRMTVRGARNWCRHCPP
jgi:gluconolactonase